MFPMYLPSTLDHKDALNQSSELVHLHPVDVSYEQLNVLNDQENYNPADLDHCSKGNKITEIFYSFMKKTAAASNHNLVRNSNAFVTKGGKIDPDFTFLWFLFFYRFLC